MLCTPRSPASAAVSKGLGHLIPIRRTHTSELDDSKKQLLLAGVVPLVRHVGDSWLVVESFQRSSPKSNVVVVLSNEKFERRSLLLTDAGLPGNAARESFTITLHLLFIPICWNVTELLLGFGFQPLELLTARSVS